MEYKISEDGELLVRGESLASSITEGDSVKLKEDNWFRTGDMAEVINGHYRVLGRKDDLVIGSSGENLNPNLIEPKISVSGIKRLCLIRDDSGEAVLLAYVGRHLSYETIEGINSELRSQIAALGLSSQLRKTVLVENDLMEEQEFKLTMPIAFENEYAPVFLKAVEYNKKKDTFTPAKLSFDSTKNLPIIFMILYFLKENYYKKMNIK